MKFWSSLKEAFENSDGFSVVFHLSNGHYFNVSMRPPNWDWLVVLEGTCVETGNPVTILSATVIAYEIEEG